MKPHLILDTSHLLVGWQKDGWKGPHLQWEFGAYVNLDLAINERHDYRLTYNMKAWRESDWHRPNRQPRRLEFTR